MTLPAENLLLGTQKATAQMANRDTPFIFNEWYVAAFSDEVGQALLARKILNKRIVLFRKQSGEVVALEDRCPHRSFPLSRGLLQDDTIICGYHGFKYDAKGDLIAVPSQLNSCPKGVGVKNYKVIENGLLIWIWMGDGEQADESKLPYQTWMTDPHWACTHGYFHHPGNYVSMHENLMDLTHVEFLHGKTFGVPGYASANFDSELTEGHYKLLRSVVPTTLPPVWGKSTGLDDIDTAARIATSEFLTVGLHRVTVTFYDASLAIDKRPEYHIATAHILTPETHGSMHYFIIHGRDFAITDKALGEFMHQQLFTVFQEDVEGLGALEEILADPDPTRYEISVKSDTPAIAVRRYLKQRAEQQIHTTNSTTN